MNSPIPPITPARHEVAVPAAEKQEGWQSCLGRVGSIVKGIFSPAVKPPETIQRVFTPLTKPLEEAVPLREHFELLREKCLARKWYETRLVFLSLVRSEPYLKSAEKELLWMVFDALYVVGEEREGLKEFALRRAVILLEEGIEKGVPKIVNEYLRVLPEQQQKEIVQDPRKGVLQLKEIITDIQLHKDRS